MANSEVAYSASLHKQWNDKIYSIGIYVPTSDHLKVWFPVIENIILGIFNQYFVVHESAVSVLLSPSSPLLLVHELTASNMQALPQCA